MFRHSCLSGHHYLLIRTSEIPLVLMLRQRMDGVDSAHFPMRDRPLLLTPSQSPHIMKITRDNPISAIGYIRVSTEKQAVDDKNLERQAESIRKACAQRGMTLLGIYRDVASGADPQGLVRREELKVAADEAQSKNAVLVIPEPTRLFRNVEAAREFLKIYDIPIFSAHKGSVLSKRAILKAVAKGAETVQNIRQGTSDALAQKQAEGIVFSDHSGRVKAAAASVKARKEEADRRVLDIVRIMETVPFRHSLSHQKLADLLNLHGILTGQRRRWTRDGVRRPRAAAEAILREREEIANDNTVGERLDQNGNVVLEAEPPVSTPVPVPVPVPVPDPVQPQAEPVDRPLTEEEEERAALEKLPTFGMF